MSDAKKAKSGPGKWTNKVKVLEAQLRLAKQGEADEKKLKVIKSKIIDKTKTKKSSGKKKNGGGGASMETLKKQVEDLKKTVLAQEKLMKDLAKDRAVDL
jgi:hypothetical protein